MRPIILRKSKLTEIKSLIKTAIEKFGDNPAVIDDQEQVLYSELLEKISDISANFRVLNILQGSRIAIVAEPSIQYVIMLLALISYSAVACPLSTRNPQSIIKNQIKRLDPNLVITDENLNNLFQKNNHSFPLSDSWKLENEASIIFSSGTSGKSKAIIHTLGNHYYSALGSNENIKLRKGDRWMLFLPLYHISGMAIIYRCLLSGAAIVIPDKNIVLEDFISDYKITHLSVVSSQLKTLIGSPIEKISALKAILVGGEAIPESLIKNAYDKKLPIYTTYGMTETSSQLTTTAPNDNIDKLLTSGRLLKFREIKIDKTGEILARGKVLFKSYLDSENCVDDNGWFNTGDIGIVDDHGYLIVQGRKDNMFISGGENIYPEMIEQVLRQNKHIQDAIIVPVADIKFGYRPIAFIKWHDKNIDTDELDKFLNDRLPCFMHPKKYFEFPSDYVKRDLKNNRSFFIELAQKLTI